MKLVILLSLIICLENILSTRHLSKTKYICGEKIEDKNEDDSYQLVKVSYKTTFYTTPEKKGDPDKFEYYKFQNYFYLKLSQIKKDIDFQKIRPGIKSKYSGTRPYFLFDGC